MILTSPERNYGAGRVGALRVLTHIVETLQHPAYCAVTAAHQDLVVGNVTKHVQPASITVVRCGLGQLLNFKLQGVVILRSLKNLFAVPIK